MLKSKCTVLLIETIEYARASVQDRYDRVALLWLILNRPNDYNALATFVTGRVLICFQPEIWRNVESKMKHVGCSDLEPSLKLVGVARAHSSKKKIKASPFTNLYFRSLL